MRQRKKNPSYCDGESLNTFRGIIAKLFFNSKYFIPLQKENVCLKVKISYPWNLSFLECCLPAALRSFR